jgi:hypothetical protein
MCAAGKEATDSMAWKKTTKPIHAFGPKPRITVAIDVNSKNQVMVFDGTDWIRSGRMFLFEPMIFIW